MLLSRRAAVWPLAIAETISWGLLFYTFGVLLGPTTARLGVTEASVAGAFSVALLAAGLVSPAVGRLVDRRGAGAVMTAGGLLGAFGFLCLGAATAPWHLFFVWACLGVAHACTSYEPAFATVMRWFEAASERRRALLVITSLGGLASTIFVPLAAWLVSAVGFERTLVVFASLLVFVVTPLHLLVGSAGASPAGPLPVHVSTTSSSTQRRRTVLLTSVVSVQSFASMGAAAFLFPFLVGGGASAAEAGALAGLTGAAQVPARLLYVPLCRVIPSRRRFALLLFVQAAGVAGLATLEGAPRVVALLAFGAANGLATLERASVVEVWFGVHGYGARSGVLAAGSALARAAAPLCVGMVARAASYGHAFVGLACALLAAAFVQTRAETALSFRARPAQTSPS